MPAPPVFVSPQGVLLQPPSSWRSAYGASSAALRVIQLFVMDSPYLLLFPALSQGK